MSPNIPPVEVTVVGQPPAGNPIPDGTVAVTPDHQPNIIVNVISPLAAVFIRFGNVFMGAFVGLFAIGIVGVQPGEYLALIKHCAAGALPGALVLLAKDIWTIFGRLEGKYPLLTGSV